MKPEEISKFRKEMADSSKYKKNIKILEKHISFQRYSRGCNIDRADLRHKIGSILRDKFKFSTSDAADAAVAFVEIWRYQ